jgi:hypothetical protein
MTTALDLITGAARLIGVVFKSETLADDEANDGLTALNDMLDTWSNDNLSTFVYGQDTFSLTGATSYTIGTGGAFNTTRPINIVTAVVRISSIDYPLEIISQEQYQTEVALKSITSSIPQYLVYDNGYPLGTIKMYPVPVAGSSLILLTNKPLSNLSTLTDTISLPPGWKRAIKYNLAIEMAPEYGAEIPDYVIANARTSLGAIRRAVSINSPMPLIPSPVSRYSIYGGTE